MGAGLAEPIDEVGTGRSMFLTRTLWGVGSTAPYLHDGRATTLTEAILEHGGEADSSLSAFQALSTQDQKNLIVYLNNQVLYKIVPAAVSPTTATTTTTTSTTIRATTTTTIPARSDLKETGVIGIKLTGGRLRIIDRVQNLGTTGTETGFSVGLYLSTDNVITTSDIKIGGRTSPALPRNGISLSSNIVPLPSVSAGTYYVGACVDDTQAIAESRDDNNCKAGNTITLP
jgi:hypothetical protein